MDSNRSNVKVTSTALAPLQPSPKGTMLVGRRPRSQVTSGSLKNRIIVGKSGKIGSPKLTRVNRPSTKDSATTTVTIFNAASEAQTDISMVDLNSTTNKRDSVIQMLTSAHPSGQYFELLAEERRVALAEALNENEKLWMQVIFLLVFSDLFSNNFNS